LAAAGTLTNGFDANGFDVAALSAAGVDGLVGLELARQREQTHRRLANLATRDRRPASDPLAAGVCAAHQLAERAGERRAVSGTLETACPNAHRRAGRPAGGEVAVDRVRGGPLA